jgi:hypothetical protein
MLTLDRKTAMLPPFGRLALIAFVVDAPLIGFALVRGNLRIALSLFAGWVLAIAIYGLLHMIIGRGLDLLTDSGGRSQAGRTAQSLAFVILTLGKYVLIGLLLFAAWRTSYLELLPFLGGYVLAQIAITWLSVAQSKKAMLG